MKMMDKLLEELRKKWRPTTSEAAEVEKTAGAFVNKLGSALKKARIKAKPVVGGSGAKGTWLKGMHDIDVFVCFDYAKYKGKSSELSEFLASAAKKAFKSYERLHGSRDYFRVRHNGYNFEIVPILKIKKAGQALNITDVSLLHADWVKGKIRRNNALADDIRLAKAFCKAQRVYGAESYVSGFSGYACEVLTAYYGSFLSLAKAAAKWKPKLAAANWAQSQIGQQPDCAVGYRRLARQRLGKQVAAGKKIIIDAENHYRKRDPLRELNQAKVQSELIVIDPVQADRNATAALSNETLDRFISAAEAFIKRPEKSFFERQEINVDTLLHEAKGKQLTIVEADPARGKEDVTGAKLVKAYEHMLLQLKKKGFTVTKSGWEWNKKGNALFWYILQKGVPAPEIRYGPPLNNKMHAEKFREEHTGKKGRRLFEKNGRLYAEIERPYKQPEQLISQLVTEDSYLKDKAKSYTIKSFG